MLNQEQLRRDLFVAKALIWTGPQYGIRWCKVVVLTGPNEHGQYTVKRLRDGWLGVTTEVRNINTLEKEQVLAMLD